MGCGIFERYNIFLIDLKMGNIVYGDRIPIVGPTTYYHYKGTKSVYLLGEDHKPHNEEGTKIEDIKIPDHIKCYVEHVP